jgi:putative phosphoribosyl transferase
MTASTGSERYRDRVDAGRRLTTVLADTVPGSDVLVLGLPRGGVPVAAEVAQALGAELDVLLVRKLGVPGHEELAMGAIASDGVELLDRATVHQLGITPDEVAAVAARERAVLAQRAEAYRGDRPPPVVAGRTVVVVDDGLATGSTMGAALAAVAAIEPGPPARLVAAVPVGARQAIDRLAELADEVVCPLVPEPFEAVGRWYDDFRPTTDDEVRALLGRGQDGGIADPPHRSPAP